MERYNEGIGITAGLLMLKWELLSQHIHSNNLKLEPGDNVNVFINFEGILRNLSTQKNLGELVNFHKQKLVIELEAAILNLVAHYRMYFKKERVNPTVYLYYTSLAGKKQQMEVYNKFYRTWYENRYMHNPQFRGMGEIMYKIIIPETKLILSYVPGCHFLVSETFDSSIIPLTVSELSEAKNVIITTDAFDTLYLFNPNFIPIYLKRHYSNLNVISSTESAVRSIIKDENPFDLTIFNSELYYKLLLSVKGSTIRNIRSARGLGYGKLLKLIKEGIDRDIVLKDFESIDSVIELFPEKIREDIRTAFQCTDLEIQRSLLSDADISGLQDQMIDKLDMSSLEVLNNKRFLEFPINLQWLLE